MTAGAVINSLAASMGISAISMDKSLEIVNIRREYLARMNRSVLYLLPQS
jgi:hypothetical protein